MDYIAGIFERTRTEINIAAICSAASAGISFLVGGVDAPIQALLVLIVADYATGMIAGWKTGMLSSDRGFRGVTKKVAIVAAVALANVVDVALGTHAIRAAVIGGYAGMESLSLIENVDRMGYGEYIPPFLRTKLEQLRVEKGVKL